MTSFFNFFCGNGWWGKRVSFITVYSQVALLADFNSALSGLTFIPFGFANFTVRIDLKVLKPIFALNGILFFFTMLTLFLLMHLNEGALVLVSQLWARDQIDTSQSNLLFHRRIPVKYHFWSTWFFIIIITSILPNWIWYIMVIEHLIIKTLLRKGIYLGWIIVQFKLFYKIQYITKWSDIPFLICQQKQIALKQSLIWSFWTPKENTGQIWPNTKQFGQMVECSVMN